MIKSISCGLDTSFAIKDDDSVIVWGKKEYDYMKVPTIKDKINAISFSSAGPTIINKDNELAIFDLDPSKTEFDNQFDFPNIKAKAVSSGEFSTVAIKEDDTMFILSYGGFLSDDNMNSISNIKVKAVSCGGGYFILAIKEDGTLIKLGDSNPKIQLPESLKVKAVDCGKDTGYQYVVAIKEDGTLEQWGDTSQGQKDNFPEEVKVVSVSCGATHSVAIKEDGTLVQWGDTSKRQNDNFPEGIKVKAVSCGNNHSVALTEDGKIIQWGDRSKGQKNNYPSEFSLELPSFPSPPPLDLISSQTSEVFNINPFPKYSKKIQVDTLPKTPISYTSSTTAFDPVMQTDVTIEEAIADPDKPLIVKVNNTYSLVDRNYIKSGIKDGSLIRYGCTRSGLLINPKIIYGKNPFVYLKGLQSGNFMVLLSELDYALKDDSIRAIELYPSGDVFPLVASMKSIIIESSLNAFGEDISLLGADHCQQGSQQTVYTIRVLELNKSGGSRKTRKMSKRLKRKTLKRRKMIKPLKRKTRKYNK